MAEKKPKVEPVAEKSPSAKAAPKDIDGDIRAAAQRIYEDRRARGLDGDEVSDWLAAEAEVKKPRK